MEKAQLLAELTAIGGPIEDQLHALATERRLPRLAVGACQMRIEEAAPALRDVLSRAALGLELSDDEATLLFRGLHILAVARDPGGFRALGAADGHPQRSAVW